MVYPLLHRPCLMLPPPRLSTYIRYKTSFSPITFSNHEHSYNGCFLFLRKHVIRPLAVHPETNQGQQPQELIDNGNGNDNTNIGIILSACLVGVLTGFGVVIFNNSVHHIHDFFWDGIPPRGASWLREEPLQTVWVRVLLVPSCGGFIVSILNFFRAQLVSSNNNNGTGKLNALLRPLLKAVAACVTLGTGNSLGPEGPSVEIGASIAKGVTYLFDKSPQTKLSLLAAGSAAGISSGFNAAVAGCFFAVESVLWPSTIDSSLTNTTSMVILSAVIASVVSEVGLGSEPAFKVPEYDFRSLGELPLYLLLGMLCGLVSLSLSRCTSYMLVTVNNIHKAHGMPKDVFPLLGGLTIGIIALVYPEILYWGFENVDILLESGPFVEGLSAPLLLQLAVVKIMATSLCRACGLVGGYYAPSLFIGASTGMAYGKFISLAVAQSNLPIHLPILEVASPQAYGLVGMAATLAGVCQVPLTAVLLLFELTQDYRIVLPLLGAVGMSSWITFGQTSRGGPPGETKYKEETIYTTQQPETSSTELSWIETKDGSFASNLCVLESSLCTNDSNIQTEELKKRIFVSEAMRTRYVTVRLSTLLLDAVTLMLAEKQFFAMIVDTDDILIGQVTLTNIQTFSKFTKIEKREKKELLVSDICSLEGDKCVVKWTITPSMDIRSAQLLIEECGVSYIPVVVDHIDNCRGQLVGILDKESISLTCRALATREFLK